MRVEYLFERVECLVLPDRVCFDDCVATLEFDTRALLVLPLLGVAKVFVENADHDWSGVSCY
jgi:hypothetical protein